MDQKAIVLYLCMKGMALDAIHQNLVETLGEKAVAYPTVTKSARRSRFTLDKDTAPPEPMEVGLNAADQAILTDLADCPFLSVRELSRRICLPRSIVHRHLTQSLHFTIPHLGWVPHVLTAEQKELRVHMASELLRILAVQSTRQWHDIVTLDESWFYRNSDHDLMWLPPGDAVPDRERYTLQSPKLMLTIVWSPGGFHIVNFLPTGCKFNAQYYTNRILFEIAGWRRRSGGTRPLKLWVHADNARPHTAKVSMDYIVHNSMKRAPHPPHPPYSPDLAPSDFFLFRYVKRKLMGYHAESTDDLFGQVLLIRGEIPLATLNGVFQEWMGDCKNALIWVKTMLDDLKKHRGMK
jgi:histone-lysine N-methyltransferase SETMAR